MNSLKLHTKSIQKVIDKEKVIRAKIMQKDESLRKIKLKQKHENEEKHRFFLMNQEIEIENQK